MTLGAAVSDSSQHQNTPELDNHVRSIGAFVGGYALLLWWIIPDVESKSVPLGIVCLTLLLSGLGRMISMTLYGVSGADQTLSMILELSAPLLLVWQYFAAKEVARTMRTVKPQINAPVPTD